MTRRSGQLRARTVELFDELPVPKTARIGVDVVDVAEWERCIDLAGPRLLERLFTARELCDAGGSAERLAARFAAKEAVMKVLDTGFGTVSPREIEIVSSASGRPSVVLRGVAAEAAERLAIEQVDVTISHESGLAVAAAASTRTEG